jgi:large subunit ribosomal protein L6
MATSRVGRKPISIPSGVEVKVQDKALFIKGPKGHTTMPLHAFVNVVIEDGHLNVRSNTEAGYRRSGSGSKLTKAIVGTFRSEISNFVEGVSKGFERKLQLVGVGYRAQIKGKILNLSLGYSHPVNFEVPEGITIETPSLTEIIIKGIDKHLVGHTASKIRAKRSPEPYKGKGVRYSNEVIILKETKKK